MIFTLMTHTNRHGYGVSLMKYADNGDLLAGFVLKNFDDEPERRRYLAELSIMTGFRVEHLNDERSFTSGDSQ